MQGVSHYVAMMNNEKDQVSGSVILQYEVSVGQIDCDEALTTKEREQLLIDKALLHRANEVENG